MGADDLVGRCSCAIGGIADTPSFLHQRQRLRCYIGVRELETAGHYPATVARLQGFAWREVIAASSSAAGQVAPEPSRSARPSGRSSPRRGLLVTICPQRGETASAYCLCERRDKPIARTPSAHPWRSTGLRLDPENIAHPDNPSPCSLQLADDRRNEELAAHAGESAEMKTLLEKLITGRSTPGAKQANDVEVVRYPVLGAMAKRKSRVANRSRKAQTNSTAARRYETIT